MNATNCKRCQIVLPSGSELARRLRFMYADARRSAREVIASGGTGALEDEPPLTFDDLVRQFEEVICDQVRGVLEGLCEDCQLDAMDGKTEPVVFKDVARPVADLDWLMNDGTGRIGQPETDSLIEWRIRRRLAERRGGRRPN